MEWKKFISRKLVLTVLVVACIVAANLLGISLDEHSLNAVIAVVLGFIGSQGLVDTASAWKTGTSVAEAVRDVRALTSSVSGSEVPTEEK